MKVSNILVESANKLTAEQTKQVADLLKAKLGTSEFEQKVTPSLIGGLRITINNTTQFDASLHGKLEQLRTL